MALHKDFPKDKFAILNPEIRWFPVDEALREQGYGKLLPPFGWTSEQTAILLILNFQPLSPNFM